MNLLSKEEIGIVRAFLEVPIPEYIREYSDERFDLMDCYEVAFTFANDVLRGKSIDPNASPWGDGQSVIFDPSCARLLSDIQGSNLGADVNRFCSVFLQVLSVFESHFAF